MLKHDLFFISSEDRISDKTIEIKNKIEANHISTVLRKSEGDIITFSDGSNFFYYAQITLSEKKRIEANILETHPIPEDELQIHLNISLLKGSNFDLQIEKAIEIGVSSIQPIVTDHVIAKKAKVEKWTDVIKTALKQSKQPRFVSIYEPKKLIQLTKKPSSLWIVPEITSNQTRFSDLSIQEKTLHLFIGPEGGFSNREIDFFKSNDASFHSLGNNRLRAETATWVSLTLLKNLRKNY